MPATMNMNHMNPLATRVPGANPSGSFSRSMPLRNMREMRNEISAQANPTTYVRRYWLIWSIPSSGTAIVLGAGNAAFETSISTPATAAETLNVT